MYRPPAKGYPVWDASGKKGAKTQNDGILGAFSIVSESALLLLFLLWVTKGSVEALEEKKGEKVREAVLVQGFAVNGKELINLM